MAEDTMVPEHLSTNSIEALQGVEQRKIMDLVDRLRRTGLSSVLQLPQVVVCGDQSSGKSSVLEALTEIPFPRKENLCTRFATEIVLRRHTEESICTRIIPDKNRPSDEQETLRSFNKPIKDFTELPELIDEATVLMGLDGQLSGGRAFARDVLSIEICGPGRPQLTLVDLPGLVHAKNKLQSDSDIKLIHSLVEEYISNPRTIMLAVISAKNDLGLQLITEYCHRVDPKGARTLGIITKPDHLRPGSSNETAWLDLAQNRDIYFELGWHMLKNRTEDQLGFSFNERNVDEELFFSTGSYRQLSRDMVGIVSLRQRLSQLLHNHLKSELPSLKVELDDMWKETGDDIKRMGDKRSTVAEQRMYLMGLSMDLHRLVQSAVRGDYGEKFFGSLSTTTPVDSEANLRRLRAVVQHLNLEFAHQIRLRGHKYDMPSELEEDAPAESVPPQETPSPPAEDGPSEEGPATPDDSDESNTMVDKPEDPSTNEESTAPATDKRPTKLSRSQAIDWVLTILQRTRGRELPGNFNPMLINQLFWEQSEPWGKIAMAHVEKCSARIRRFVDFVLEHVTTSDVQARLRKLKINDALKQSTVAAREELGRIVEDKRRHPMTYNHYYTTTIQKLQHKRHVKAISDLSEKATVTVIHKDEKWEDGERKEYLDPKVFNNLVNNHIEQDMDKFSAQLALDCEMAYYKDEMKYFIAVVVKQVIERHLIDPLPDKILSPMIVAGLSDNEVKRISGEPAEVTQRREFLERRREMLEQGREAFLDAMGEL